MEQSSQTEFNNNTAEVATQTDIHILPPTTPITLAEQLQTLQYIYPEAIRQLYSNKKATLIEIHLQSQIHTTQDFYKPQIWLRLSNPPYKVTLHQDFDFQLNQRNKVLELLESYSHDIVGLIVQCEEIINQIQLEHQIIRIQQSYTANSTSQTPQPIITNELKEPRKSLTKEENYQNEQYHINDVKQHYIEQQDGDNYGKSIEIDSFKNESQYQPLVSCDFSRFNKDFDIIKKIGSGGYGQVFMARNKLDGNVYAIKRILLDYSNEKLCQKTKNEAILLSRIQHPNIVRYYQAWTEEVTQQQLEQEKLQQSEDYFSEDDESEQTGSEGMEVEIKDDDEEEDPYYIEGEEEDFEINWVDNNNKDGEVEINIMSNAQGDQTPLPVQRKHQPQEQKTKQFLFIQMEYCSGETLKSKIDERSLSSTQKKNILRQILGALVYLHSKQYIHRDLKPQNIFLNGNLDVKLGDFGLATEMKAEIKHEKVVHQQLSRTVSMSNNDISMTQGVGTFMYLAPEQENQTQYDSKVDVFSLGIILFELYYPFKTEMERRDSMTKLKNQSLLPNDFEQRVGLQDLDVGEKIKSLVQFEPKKRPDAKKLLNEYQDKQFQQMIRQIANPNSPDYQAMIQTLFDCKQLRNTQGFFASCLEEALSSPHDSFFRDYQRNYNNFKERIISIFKLRGGIELELGNIIPAQNTRLLQSITGKIEEYSQSTNSSCRFISQDGELLQYCENMIQSSIYWFKILPLKNFRRYQFADVQQTDKKVSKHKCISYDIITEEFHQIYLGELVSIAIEVVKQFKHHANFEIRISHSQFIELILNEIGYSYEFMVRLKQNTVVYSKLLRVVHTKNVQLKSDLSQTLQQDFSLSQQNIDRLIQFLSLRQEYYVADYLTNHKASEKKNRKSFFDLIESCIKNSQITEILSQIETFVDIISKMKALEGFKIVFEVLQENELSYFYNGVTFEVVEIYSPLQQTIRHSLTDHKQEQRKFQYNKTTYIIGGNYSTYLGNKCGCGIQIQVDQLFFSKFNRYQMNTKEKFEPLERKVYPQSNSQDIQVLLTYETEALAETMELAYYLWEHKISAMILLKNDKVNIQMYDKLLEIHIHQKFDKSIMGTIKSNNQKMKSCSDVEYKRLGEEIKNLIDNNKVLEANKKKGEQSKSNTKLASKNI